jgi:hypothetical protein
MFKRIPAALASTLLLLALPHSAFAAEKTPPAEKLPPNMVPQHSVYQGKPMKLVSQAIAVESKGERVIINFTVNNRTENKVWVPRSVAAEQSLSGQIFEIRNGAGDPVPYIGPMVKRGPIGAADFTEIRARMRHRNKIDITDSYAFRKGPGNYELTYVGSYLLDPNDPSKSSTLALAPVQFSFTGK